MSDGFCLEGNCGFPVVVSGLSSATVRKNPNDITLQFNKIGSVSFDNTSQTIQLSDPSSQSFFIGGNQYLLNTIRICQATPNGLEPSQTVLPELELQFWGTPPANAVNHGKIAVLIIPIYANATGNIYATNLINILNGNNKDLISVFPENTSVIRYETCIEYGEGSYKNKKIIVGYWQSGITFSFPLSKRDYLANGIPKVLIENQSTYSAFTQTGAKGTKTFDKKDQVDNAVSSLSYTTTVTASTTDFTKRFSKMTYTIGITSSTRKAPQALKCKAIDRSKDIKNGMLIIDPSTGELLTDIEDEQAKKDAQFASIPSSTITGGDVQKWLSITLGTLGGTILLALAIWAIMHFTAGQTEAGKAAAATAAALPKAAIHWVDLLLPTFLGLCLFGIGTIISVSIIMNRG